MSNEEIIWVYLRNEGLSDFAVAGIMGNLYAESGLISNNLQNNYEAILGMTDSEYTEAVDNGSYGNFVRDMAGYGLAQWTFWSRKQDLLTLAKGKRVSIGDLTMQLEFLCSELVEFGLWDKLNACRSVRDASNLILFEYEKPQDMSTAVQNARANWSQGYYDKYAGKQILPSPPEKELDRQYCVIGFLICSDKATARQKLSSFQAAGFQRFITIADP